MHKRWNKYDQARIIACNISHKQNQDLVESLELI